MIAFRMLALAYALAALLIAPAWLAADEEPAAVPEVVAPGAVDAAVEVEPATEADAESEPAVEPAPAPAEPQRRADGAEVEKADARARPSSAKRRRPPIATTAASASVTITDFDYAPKTVTVDVGDTVTWNNRGPTPHTATAENGSFDTGMLNQGESGSHTFSSAGTISYICTPHPFMKGTVVVRAASAGADDDGGSGGAGTTAGTSDDGSGADDGSGLPATGTETLLIALLGAATLGAGLRLRRRAEA